MNTTQSPRFFHKWSINLALWAVGSGIAFSMTWVLHQFGPCLRSMKIPVKTPEPKAGLDLLTGAVNETNLAAQILALFFFLTVFALLRSRATSRGSTRSYHAAVFEEVGSLALNMGSIVLVLSAWAAGNAQALSVTNLYALATAAMCYWFAYVITKP